MTLREEARVWRKHAEFFFSKPHVFQRMWDAIYWAGVPSRMAKRLQDHTKISHINDEWTSEDRAMACLFLAFECLDEAKRRMR